MSEIYDLQYQGLFFKLYILFPCNNIDKQQMICLDETFKQLQRSFDNNQNNSFNMWFEIRIQKIQYYRVYAQYVSSIVLSFKASFSFIK